MTSKPLIHVDRNRISILLILTFFFFFFVLLVASLMQSEDRAREREEINRAREKLYTTMAEQSPLAATLKQIYNE